MYIRPLDLAYRAKDSQKIKIKKKTKTPRITDEGWNSQKRLSDPVEKKMKEGKRRKKRLLYLHLKFINDNFHINGMACLKNMHIVIVHLQAHLSAYLRMACHI